MSSSSGSTPAGRRGRIGLLACEIVLLITAGCATAPPAVEAAVGQQWFGLFPDEIDLYFAVNPTRIVRAVAARVFEERKLRSVLRRTDVLYGGVAIVAESAPVVYVAAPGRFPAGMIRCGLRFKRDWRRVSRAHWISSESGLELFLSGRSLVLAANADLTPVVVRLVAGDKADVRPLPLPPAAAGGMGRADLFVFFPVFPQELYRPITRTALPLRKVWIGAREEEGRFAFEGTFVLESERGTRLFSMGLKLLLTHFFRKAEVLDLGPRLRATSVTQAGGEVHVEGVVLTAEELETIIRSFKET